MSAAPDAGGATIVDPGNFAQYVFTIVVAFGGTAIAVAVARRILAGGRRALGPGDGSGAEEVRRLASDLDQQRLTVAEMRRELDEVHNRLDFAERLLAQSKERGLLNAAREPGRE